MSIHRFLASAPLNISRWKQFVDSIDLVAGDAAKDISEPGLRIDTIEFGCFDQRVGYGGRFASRIRAHEKVDEMTIFSVS